MQTQTLFNSYQPTSGSLTSPLSNDILSKVNQLIGKKQWVLLTAECPRPTLQQMRRYHALGHNMVQMKPSHTLTQAKVVEKAIRSGNACAVIANGYFTTAEQASLHILAVKFDCEVIYLNGEYRIH